MNHDKKEYLRSVHMLGASIGLNRPIYLCSLLTNAHPGLTRGTEIRYSRSFLQQSTVGLFSSDTGIF